MSTKREEPCPECQTPVLASDHRTLFHDWHGSFWVRQWFYYCEKCHWTWANDIQRANNSKFYNQAVKARYEEQMYG